MEHQQPSATQSADDVTSHDDVIKTVSGPAGMLTSLHRATSDAYPTGGSGARTRNDRRSPTSGVKRGRGTSKPVAITCSAPEAAAAGGTAPPRPVDPRLPISAHHGDHRHSSGSDEHLNKEDEQTKKKQATSSLTWRFTDDSADTTSNSVIVVEPRTAGPASDLTSSYEQAGDSVLGISDSSRWTGHEEPRSFETTSIYSRQRCAGNEDPARRKVKSEGQQRLVVYLLNLLTKNSL